MPSQQIDPQSLERYLIRAVEELDVNPLSSQFLRRMATEEPELFTRNALKYFEPEVNQRAQRFLGGLMLRYTPILDRIVDPARGSREWALGLSLRLSRIDSSLDFKLAHRLPRRNAANPDTALKGASALRCLDILDNVSPARRLIPVLGHLIYDDDPAIAERTTLFVGRRIQNPEWAATQLSRSSVRVRANALESLWGLSSSAAICLFENSVNDISNRVAGNALVGLYLSGRKQMLDQLTAMATGEEVLFRSTAVWVMRKLCDPSFVPILTMLARDHEPQVRSAALRSLIEIRRAISNVVPACKPEEPTSTQVSIEIPAPEPAEEQPKRVTPLPGVPDLSINLDGSRFSILRR
jgi:hypothetical protein